MNRYGTDCVAPFGAWVVFVVVTTGLHPWLQHAVPLGLLPPNGGTASTLLKKNVSLGAKGDYVKFACASCFKSSIKLSPNRQKLYSRELAISLDFS